MDLIAAVTVATVHQFRLMSDSSSRKVSVLLGYGRLLSSSFLAHCIWSFFFAAHFFGSKLYVWGEVGETAWTQIHCLNSFYLNSLQGSNLRMPSGFNFLKSPSVPPQIPKLQMRAHAHAHTHI